MTESDEPFRFQISLNIFPVHVFCGITDHMETVPKIRKAVLEIMFFFALIFSSNSLRSSLYLDM